MKDDDYIEIERSDDEWEEDDTIEDDEVVIEYPDNDEGGDTDE